MPRKFIDDSPYVADAEGFDALPDTAILNASSDIATFAVKPGDIVAFHFRTLHSAPATTLHADRRRVISFRYVSPDATWATRPLGTSPPLDANSLRDGDVIDDERFPLVII